MSESNSPLAFVCSPSYDDTGGVVSYRVDVDRRELERVQITPVESPKFLTVDPARECLYTANDASGGRITAFRFDESGELTELNGRASGGENPCYVTADGTGSHLLVANYTGGSVSMLPIGSDGELGEATAVVEHTGSSVDPDRQQEPHPHSIGPGPENRFAFAPDLGTDRVVTYRLNLDDGSLEPAETPDAELHDGAGPRHFAFHPNGRVAYVINELDSTLTAFDFDPETGALTERATHSTLPAGFEDTNYPADVHVHPSGRWVYGSNRGHDSIAVFETDAAGADLRPVGFESTYGEWPRHFVVGPDGDTLFAENQESDTIVPFDLRADGDLSPWESTESLTEPLCMAFAEPT